MNRSAKPLPVFSVWELISTYRAVRNPTSVPNQSEVRLKKASDWSRGFGKNEKNLGMFSCRVTLDLVSVLPVLELLLSLSIIYYSHFKIQMMYISKMTGATRNLIVAPQLYHSTCSK